MKKILALAAAAALTAGVSAYAANPFSDVSTDDWAYQAVSDLSDQGVVEGYPDGTFKGERNITRYELAQIIARLMAKEDQLNAEQRATLDKLAGEYADELANLGVRVSNLEKKVGNIAWSGNARMRFNQGYDEDKKGDATDSWNGRMKIIAHATVNDTTYAEGRFVTNMDFKDADSAGTSMDEIIVHHQLADKLGVTLGRQDLYIGQSGIYYDDEFDGAIANYGTDKLTLDLGYGRFDAQNYAKLNANDSKPEAFLARLHGADKSLSYELNYIDYAGGRNTVWGAGLTAGVTSDIDVFGDYFKNTDAKGDPAMWTAGAAYGHTNWKKPGSFRIGAQYINAEKNAYLGGTTYTVSGPLDLLVNNDTNVTRAKYWLATADVILQKNVKLHGEYGFHVKTDGTDTDYDDLYTVSLNYIF